MNMNDMEIDNYMLPINHNRGENALRGLRAYKGVFFSQSESAAEHGDPSDMSDAISDLICDLRHLADRYPALNWRVIEERAERDYYAESDDNPDDIEQANREDYDTSNPNDGRSFTNPDGSPCFACDTPCVGCVRGSQLATIREEV